MEEWQDDSIKRQVREREGIEYNKEWRCKCMDRDQGFEKVGGKGSTVKQHERRKREGDIQVDVDQPLGQECVDVVSGENDDERS